MQQLLLLGMANVETRRLLLFDDLSNIGQKNYATIQKYEQAGGKYYHIAKELYGTWHKTLKAHAQYRRTRERNLSLYTEKEIKIKKKMLIDDMLKTISRKHYSRTHDIPFEYYKNNGGKFDLEFIHQIYNDDSEKSYKTQKKWKQAIHDFYLEKERKNKLEWESQFPLAKIVEIIEEYYYNNRKRPDEKVLRKIIPYLRKRLEPYGTIKFIIETYSRIPIYEEKVKKYKEILKTNIENIKIDTLRRTIQKQKQEIAKIYEEEIKRQQFIRVFKQDADNIIQKHGYFSFGLYEKEKTISHHSKDWIRRRFGSLKELYSIAGLNKSQLKTQFKRYTDEQIRTYLINIYNKYGFVSTSLVNNEPNKIPHNRLLRRYGGLAKACEYLGVPYTPPAHKTKLFAEVEAKVKQILNLNLIEEQRWPWLKYKALLSVDIFIPLLGLVIEADGDQHYKKYSRYYDSEEEFLEAQKRDKIKDVELPKHGYDLIRFHRKNLKDIEQILAPYKAKRDLIYDLCAF